MATRPRPTRCFGLALIALLGDLSGVAAPLHAQDKGKKYALLVGVQTYDPRFFTPLRYAEEDVLTVGKALEALEYNVLVMTTHAKQPAHKPNTAKKVLDMLDRRLKGLEKQDTLIIVLSGHGVQFASDRVPLGEAKESYFCPEEADPTDRSTLVPMSKLLGHMAACPAERKLLLVDACRNEVLSDLGKSNKEVELEPTGRNPRSVPQGMLALFSCQSGEKSWEHPGLEHSVFSYYVARYLRGAADEKFYPRGELQLDELVYYVRRETKDYVLARLTTDQNPELVGRSADWSLGRLFKPFVPPEAFRQEMSLRERNVVVRNVALTEDGKKMVVLYRGQKPSEIDPSSQLPALPSVSIIDLASGGTDANHPLDVGLC